MTKHPDFELVVSNGIVHRITRTTFNRDEKSTLNEMPAHKQNRYIAYGHVARWIYRRLGRGNRVPLPACAVDRIRQLHSPPLVEAGAYTTLNYPEFVGFQEAAEEEMVVDNMPQRDDE